MTYDELNESQRTELKQQILEERNMSRGEGTSYEELAMADDLVSDEDAREWAEGVEFSADDFSSSSQHTFRVRVTWPVSKTFSVPASDGEEALWKIRKAVNSGEMSCYDPGWEADDSDESPVIELEEEG